MINRYTLSGALIGMWFICGCCCGGNSGIWDEAMSQAEGDMFRDMEDYCEYVPEGTEKDQVMVLLDQGYIDGNAGRLGLWDVSMFDTAVQDACSDNLLDSSEVQVLQDKYDKMLASN